MPTARCASASDEGIRTHGSVDYMSIMRRHSHGCHRLHNHIAVRLFSFIVNHRAPPARGPSADELLDEPRVRREKHTIHIKQGGYVFKLDKPIFVTVEEGRVRGKVDKPITTAIPRFNAECQAYYMPDGRAVLPRPDGTLVATLAPPCAAAAAQRHRLFDDHSPLNRPLGQVPAGELGRAEPARCGRASGGRQAG